MKHYETHYQVYPKNNKHNLGETLYKKFNNNILDNEDVNVSLIDALIDSKSGEEVVCMDVTYYNIPVSNKFYKNMRKVSIEEYFECEVVDERYEEYEEMVSMYEKDNLEGELNDPDGFYSYLVQFIKNHTINKEFYKNGGRADTIHVKYGIEKYQKGDKYFADIFMTYTFFKDKKSNIDELTYSYDPLPGDDEYDYAEMMFFD